VIHHALTAELNALRIAELNAEAERRRLRAALPKRTHRPLSRLMALVRERRTAHRPTTASRRLYLDGAADQSS
jgi:hypothetical protein